EQNVAAVEAAKTLRLRGLRLAKEAADRAAAGVVVVASAPDADAAPAKRSPRRAAKAAAM
ncbi:hypothetical protein, partial [Stella sp.]|uniref:hypothetical protein n=1 Tax=Stella sp. TaxID=2912054 RepID=UPI0035B14A62